jgi:HTH-type transcriptional regulator/antitoxin HigA
MNRKRPLSLSMIRALHGGLKIPAEVLLQESPQAPYSADSRKPRKRARTG